MGLSAGIFREALPLFVKSMAAYGTAVEQPEVFTLDERQFYPDLTAPEVPPQLDLILVDARDADWGLLPSTIRRLRLKIQRFGAILVLMHADECLLDRGIPALAEQGLSFYRGWTLLGQTLTAWGETERPKSGTLLLRFQRAGYDPVLHARSAILSGEFGTALSILQEVPDAWFRSDEHRGLHGSELLVAYLAQDRLAGPELRLQHLVCAMRAYTRACTLAPLHVPAYQYMATFWARAGRSDLARRMMQTVGAILPSPEMAAEVAKYKDAAPVQTRFRYPDFDPGWKLRILYLCHVESDYGSDLLYDGMRRLLGAENVVEYPWKPTIHGQNLDQAFDYPCTFHWPDGPTPLPDLVRMASEGAFDVILFSDTTGTLPKDEIHQILDVAPDTPLFVLDMWDECGAFLEDIRRDARLGPVQGYFKREMLDGIDYGPNTWPLTFAYADDRIPDVPSWDNRGGVFFAGKLIGGTRRLTMSWLQDQIEVKGGWGTPYSQADYAALLREQLIGLCLFGNGFDTVRYWELPAHGVMLLAERSPLVVPYDFEDGKQAVFFDHALDLREKLDYYLAHPREALEIAQAGHAHLREHHTATARARQLLGQIQARLRELRTGSDAFPA